MTRNKALYGPPVVTVPVVSHGSCSMLLYLWQKPAGGVVNEYRTGDSNVRVFELTMKNDVIVVLSGFDADELLDVANVLAGSWEKV